MVARAEQGNADGPAGFGKVPGSHETVAAIVAGSTQHGDRTRWPALPNLARDGPAGILHQFGSRRTGGHRQTIGFAHPTDIEQRGLEVHDLFRHLQIATEQSLFASNGRKFPVRKKRNIIMFGAAIPPALASALHRQL